MTDPETSGARDQDASPALRRTALALLAVGVLLRIVLAILSSRVAPFSDMAWYFQASRLLDADTNLLYGVDRALLYPVFIAGLAAAGMGSLLAMYAVQSLLTLAAVAATGGFAARIGGARIGWLTVALLAPQLTIAQYSGLLLSESLFLPLFAVWLALVWPRDRLARGGDVLRVVAAGAAAGLAGAVRPAALPLALGTCAALCVVGAGRIRRTALFAAAAGIAFAASVYGTAHLAGVLPSFVPTAGANLYLGNGPGGRLDGGGLERLPPSLQAIPEPAERNARARREALREMARRPLRTALMGLVRLIRLGSVNPGRIEHDALVLDGLPSPLVLGWLALEWIGLVALVAVAWRGGTVARSAWLFTAFVAAPYVFVLMATFVQTRFRLPLVILLAPLAASGLARILDAPSGPGRRRLLLVPALAAAGLVLAATLTELVLKRF